MLKVQIIVHQWSWQHISNTGTGHSKWTDTQPSFGQWNEMMRRLMEHQVPPTVVEPEELVYVHVNVYTRYAAIRSWWCWTNARNELSTQWCRTSVKQQFDRSIDQSSVIVVSWYFGTYQRSVMFILHGHHCWCCFSQDFAIVFLLCFVQFLSVAAYSILFKLL